MDRIEDIICETQGDIFRCANEMKLDMDVFVPAYMKSRFCEKSMDTIRTVIQFGQAEW